MNNVVDSGRRTDSGAIIWIPKSQVQQPRTTPTSTAPRSNVYISPALTAEAQQRYAQMQQVQVLSPEEAERRKIQSPSFQIQPSSAPQVSSFEQQLLGRSIAPEKETFIDAQQRSVIERREQQGRDFVDFRAARQAVAEGTATGLQISEVERQELQRTGYVRPTPIPTQQQRAFEGLLIASDIQRQQQEIRRFEQTREQTVSAMLKAGESPADIANILTGQKREVEEATFERLQPLIAAQERVRTETSPLLFQTQQLRAERADKRLAEVQRIESRLKELDTAAGRVSPEAKALRSELLVARRQADTELGRVTAQPTTIQRISDRWLDIRTDFGQTKAGELWASAAGRATRPLVASAVPLLWASERLKDGTKVQQYTAAGLQFLAGTQWGIAKKIERDPLPLAVTAAAGFGVGALTTRGIAFGAKVAAGAKSPLVAWGAAAGVTGAKTVMYGTGVGLLAFEGYQISQIEDVTRRGERFGETLTVVGAGGIGFSAGAATAPSRAGTVSQAVLAEASKQRVAGAPITFKAETVGFTTKKNPLVVQTTGTAPPQALKMGETVTQLPRTQRVEMLQTVRVGKQDYLVREIFQPRKPVELILTRADAQQPFFTKTFQPRASPVSQINLAQQQAITAQRPLTTRETILNIEGVKPLQVTREAQVFQGVKLDTGRIAGTVRTERVITTRQELTQPAFTSIYGRDFGVTTPRTTRFTEGTGIPQTRIDTIPGGFRIDSPGQFLQTVQVRDVSGGVISFTQPRTTVTTPSVPSSGVRRPLLDILFPKSKKAQVQLTQPLQELALPSARVRSPTISVRRSQFGEIGQARTLPSVFFIPSLSKVRPTTEQVGVGELSVPTTTFEPTIKVQEPTRDFGEGDKMDPFITTLPDLGTRFAQRPDTKQTPEMKQTQLITPQLVTIQTTDTGTPPPPPGTPTFIPIDPIIPIVPVGGFLWLPRPEDQRKRVEATRKKMKKPTGYIPSFEAIALGIYGSPVKKKLYTGMEIRPIKGETSPGTFFGIQLNNNLY